MVRVDGKGTGRVSCGCGTWTRSTSAAARSSRAQGLNLDVEKGEFVALAHGSGKTTLLNLLGGLDLPTSGSISVAGDEITSMSAAKLTTWRAQNVGFIFQNYNLIPVLDAYENVELPLLLTELSRAGAGRACETALSLVDLTDRMHNFPDSSPGGRSSGWPSRRARPDLPLCDEPTGDLYCKSADEIMELIDRLVHEHGKTVLMVTHDPRAAERAHSALDLEGGARRRRPGGWTRHVGLIADLKRKKVRTTSGSFAVALFLFGLLVAIRARSTRGRGRGSRPSRPSQGLDDPAVADRLPRPPAPGPRREGGDVRLVVRRRLPGREELLPQFAVEPESWRQMYPVDRVPGPEWNDFSTTGRGVSSARPRPSGSVGRSATASRSRASYLPGLIRQFDLRGICTAPAPTTT